MRTVKVFDSHTEGEPTRLVTDNPFDLDGQVTDKVRAMRSKFDDARSALCQEPRGHEAIVGAYLSDPTVPGADYDLFFFNNAGYLHMCGHGTIGVAATLAQMGLMSSDSLVFNTPAGPVRATLLDDDRVEISNVPSFRHMQDVSVTLGSGKVVTGDVAYGGNWFFLTHDHGADISLANLDRLRSISLEIMAEVQSQGLPGGGAIIDHIELLGEPTRPDADSKNFVLCPGGAYDRSPCGTGTSAHMACLRAAGKLGLNEKWRQESVTGSLFEGWLEEGPEGIVPHIVGTAYWTAEATVRFDPRDPFLAGFGG